MQYCQKLIKMQNAPPPLAFLDQQAADHMGKKSPDPTLTVRSGQILFLIKNILCSLRKVGELGQYL